MPSRRLTRSPRLSSALAFLLCLLPGLAFGQASVLQGGAFTQGHLPIYGVTGSSSQPVVIDSGPAGGTVTGQGVSELSITARCTTQPCAANGSGPDGTIFTINDAVSSNSTGGHSLSFSANALGGGLIEYGAFGAASALPFQFKVNGATYAFPFVSGGIVGPGTTVSGHVSCWANTVGTLLSDCGTLPTTTPGGTSGQVQYNAAGSFAGFTVAGDGTLNTGTGALTVTKLNGVTATLGGTLTTGGTVTTTSPFNLILTLGSNTNVTLPNTGTLATLAGSEALTNKTYNGNSFTAGSGTLTIAVSKTLTASNTLAFAGTDGSTLNVGTGGTLGTAAYTATSAYVPSNTQLTNSISGDVSLSNTGSYFDGPSVAQGATGTWFASGTVTVYDPGAVANIYCKLWDGTTVIASGATVTNTGGSGFQNTISLSGYLATPAANIRISCRDVTAVTGLIKFNASGNSKDGTLSAFRIN